MNSIFISPEPVSPNSLHVVGEMEAATFVGGLPIPIKTVTKTTIKTITQTATQTAFT
jgi:hypothetical protein